MHPYISLHYTFSNNTTSKLWQNIFYIVKWQWKIVMKCADEVKKCPNVFWGYCTDLFSTVQLGKLLKNNYRIDRHKTLNFTCMRYMYTVLWSLLLPNLLNIACSIQSEQIFLGLKLSTSSFSTNLLLSFSLSWSHIASLSPAECPWHALTCLLIDFHQTVESRAKIICICSINH